MHLLVDAGNTRLKLALYQSPQAVELHVFEAMEPLQIFLKQCSAHWPTIVSNVGHWPLEGLFDHFTQCIWLQPSTPLPLKIDYDTPQTLGLDRRALATASHWRFPKQPALVIDAGSCLTYDFVDADGVYRGGAISPGLQMRLRSLATFTDRLPHEQWSGVALPPLSGKSTSDSILSGVVHGLLAEIMNQQEQYREQYPALQTLISGGDANRLAAYLKSNIFADPNFLLHGLDQILSYNLAKH